MHDPARLIEQSAKASRPDTGLLECREDLPLGDELVRLVSQKGAFAGERQAAVVCQSLHRNPMPHGGNSPGIHPRTITLAACL